MFFVFLHFFRSVLVTNSANSFLDSRERNFVEVHNAQATSFPIKRTIYQPRFQAYISSNRWCIARIFQIW